VRLPLDNSSWNLIPVISYEDKAARTRDRGERLMGVVQGSYCCGGYLDQGDESSATVILSNPIS
jgi:hypothetical protein